MEKNSKIDNDYPNWSYTYVLPSSYESSTYKPEYIQPEIHHKEFKDIRGKELESHGN